MRKRIESFSCYDLVSKTSFPFSVPDYSKFKYGSERAARKIGTKLAARYYRRVQTDNALLNEIRSKQIVVVPPPYDYVPTAGYAMKEYFVRYFNKCLIKDGIAPVQETKIHRTRSYNHEYGTMSSEERKKAISSDGFHIDKKFVNHKFCLFLDDIRITGAHEHRMSEMIEKADLDISFQFLFFASLKNDAINPEIEYFLNHYYIKNLSDIDTIIRHEGFLFNTRAVKFILGASESEFCNFIATQSKEFRQTLLHYTNGNRYYELPEFKINYSHLCSRHRKI
jgi:predicted amidophosphoribosyltransferase